jgi:hypothetical protein
MQITFDFVVVSGTRCARGQSFHVTLSECEGSPVDLSHSAQIHRDASLPSGVQHDMLFLILDTPDFLR